MNGHDFISGLDPDEPEVAGLDPDEAPTRSSIDLPVTMTAQGLRRERTEILVGAAGRQDVVVEVDENGLVALKLAQAALDMKDAQEAPGLVDILPADFPLPALIKFIARTELKEAVDKASAYALSIEVKEAEGIQRADLALTALRSSVKAIQDHFEEPARIAHDLHKRITGLRADWCAQAQETIKAVGSRVYAEQQRLQKIAEEERRKAQEEADRQAREALRREAEAAAKAQAPAPIVEELQRQAKTAVAPPVSHGAFGGGSLRGSTPVKTWKARFAGTPADAEPNPDIDQLSAAQKVEFFRYLKALLVGEEKSLAAISIDWGYLNRRAASDKSTLSIVGFEAFEVGGLRAKGSRGR